VTDAFWTRTADILDRALAQPAAGRAAYVDQACAGDAALRREVLTLLAAHDRAGDFLERPLHESLIGLPEAEPDETGDAVPEQVGPYLVRGRLGAGGMGVVYLAEDTRLARRVALKAVAPGRTTQGPYRERLRQEARAAATLAHPNVAAVYALEEIDGRPYLVSEYVPGRTLREVASGGPLPVEQVLSVATQLADALAAAHAHGVVHGDLKPDNVVVTASGTVKVLDFGLAHIDGQPGTAPTGGTPDYMAPEQVRGAAADHRSDQFAFGVLIHELLSGTVPPAGGDVSLRAGTLEAVVRKCLRAAPEERYAATRELRDAVFAAHARPPGRMSADRSWSARRWWTIHQASACGVYLLALVPLWFERTWMPPGAGMPAALTGLALAVTATSVRLNLWFSTRVLPAEAAAQRVRVRTWRRGCDLALAALLAGAGLAIGETRPYPATLMVALAAGLVVANLLIEPTTERAAFGRGRDPA
jgi:hypothetical protein